MAQLIVSAGLAALGNAAGAAAATALSYGAAGTAILTGLGGAAGAAVGSLLAPATRNYGPRLGPLALYSAGSELQSNEQQAIV